MQWSRLFLIPIALLVTLLGLAVFAGGVSNAAATATCSHNGCNGQDPQTTGCVVGAYTVQTATTPSLIIQLRYSPKCGTNWSRVISKQGSSHLFATIVRNDRRSYVRSFGFSTLVYSQMVYAPIAKAQACGRIGSSVNTCTAFI